MPTVDQEVHLSRYPEVMMPIKGTSVTPNRDFVSFSENLYSLHRDHGLEQPFWYHVEELRFVCL